MDEFLSLRKMLIDLKDRVSDHFTRLIDDESTPLRRVDLLEEQATSLLDKIDSVINLAENYMPETVDAELIREIVVTADDAEKLLFPK